MILDETGFMTQYNAIVCDVNNFVNSVYVIS